jgi:hypothetical protein
MRLLDLHKSSHLQPASWELWLHFIGLSKFLCFLQIWVQKQEYLSKNSVGGKEQQTSVWRHSQQSSDCCFEDCDCDDCFEDFWYCVQIVIFNCWISGSVVCCLLSFISAWWCGICGLHTKSPAERTNTTIERRFSVIATGSGYYGIMQVLSFCIFLLEIPWNLMHSKKFQSIFVGYLIFMNIPWWKEEGSYVSK